MSAHLHDYPEHILRDMRALCERMERVCRAWGRVPGDDEAADAHTHLTNAIDTFTDAIAARDGYSEADRQMDLLRDRQDERRAAA